MLPQINLSSKEIISPHKKRLSFVQLWSPINIISAKNPTKNINENFRLSSGNSHTYSPKKGRTNSQIFKVNPTKTPTTLCQTNLKEYAESRKIMTTELHRNKIDAGETINLEKEDINVCYFIQKDPVKPRHLKLHRIEINRKRKRISDLETQRILTQENKDNYLSLDDQETTRAKSLTCKRYTDLSLSEIIGKECSHLSFSNKHSSFKETKRKKTFEEGW